MAGTVRGLARPDIGRRQVIVVGVDYIHGDLRRLWLRTVFHNPRSVGRGTRAEKERYCRGPALLVFLLQAAADRLVDRQMLLLRELEGGLRGTRLTDLRLFIWK